MKDSKKWPLWDKIYIAAKSINTEIIKEIPKAKGVLADIGGSDTQFHNLFKPFIKKYICINIKKTENQADENLIGSAEKIPLPNNSVDTVLHTSVLEHVEDPQKAVNEIYRILKKYGICILSTNMAWIYHPDPKDCFRFTIDGSKYLFRNFSDVKIKPVGGYFATIIQFIVLGLAKIPIVSIPFIILLNLIALPLDKMIKDNRLSMFVLITAKK